MSTYSPIDAYKKTGISTANEGKLIVMLYDGAIKAIRAAINEMEEDKPRLDFINNKLNKAQDLITELIVSLDFEKGGELANNLFNLYQFFNNEIMHANIKKEPATLPQIINLLIELKDVWSKISHVKKSNPVQGER